MPTSGWYLGRNFTEICVPLLTGIEIIHKKEISLFNFLICIFLHLCLYLSVSRSLSLYLSISISFSLSLSDSPYLSPFLTSVPLSFVIRLFQRRRRMPWQARITTSCPVRAFFCLRFLFWIDNVSEFHYVFTYTHTHTHTHTHTIAITHTWRLLHLHSHLHVHHTYLQRSI